MSPRMDKPHGCPDPDWCGEGCYWDCQADPDADLIETIPPGPWVCPRQRGAEPCDCHDCRRTITCR